jgi:hypothetical protein
VPYNSYILVDDKNWMASVSRQQGWAGVENSLHPQNARAVLMHWMVLAWLLQFLSPAQRTEFHELDRDHSCQNQRRGEFIVVDEIDKYRIPKESPTRQN